MNSDYHHMDLASEWRGFPGHRVWALRFLRLLRALRGPSDGKAVHLQGPG